MSSHEGLEQPSVIADTKVQELVSNHDVLKPRFFDRKIGSQCDRAPL